MARKASWGVLSVAKIGWEKVIPAMQKGALSSVDAIASRDLARAREWAGKLGIRKAYGSYEELLKDPEIDAIYNPLPNELHVPWSIKALEAGKHVLCEKPIAMNSAEAKKLADAAKASGKNCAEAFMVRFHPQWRRARDIVRSGEIGPVRSIQTFFSYYLMDPTNIRNIAPGGGALYDIGCYPITAGRFFFEAEPLRGIALIDRDPAFRTDRLTSALVDFGAGRHLDFTVSTQCTPYQRVHLCGTRGRIEIQIPVNAPQGEKTSLFIDDGSSLAGAGIRTEILPESDQYMLQGEAFSRAVRGEIELPYGIEDAVRGMRVIDALFRSEHSKSWETI